MGRYSWEAFDQAGLTTSFRCCSCQACRAHFEEADSLADVRLARAALAVERFRLARGRLPEHLAELAPQFLFATPVDPFDGAPLRYRRLAKGYLIYSVDRDGHDDGGREKPPGWKPTDKTPYDITFTVER